MHALSEVRKDEMMYVSKGTTKSANTPTALDQNNTVDRNTVKKLCCQTKHFPKTSLTKAWCPNPQSTTTTSSKADVCRNKQSLNKTLSWCAVNKYFWGTQVLSRILKCAATLDYAVRNTASPIAPPHKTLQSRPTRMLRNVATNQPHCRIG